MITLAEEGAGILGIKGKLMLLVLGLGLAIGLLTGILYVLIALGLTLIYGILHIVNFAHGEIYMLGAMGVFYCYVVFKLPFAAFHWAFRQTAREIPLVQPLVVAARVTRATF